MNEFPYIRCQSDFTLYESVRLGLYCYFLSPPKSGKSRLLEEVQKRLAAENVLCATFSCRSLIESTPASLIAKDCHSKIVTSLWQEFYSQLASQDQLYDQWLGFRKRYLLNKDSNNKPCKWIQNLIEEILFSQNFLNRPRRQNSTLDNPDFVLEDSTSISNGRRLVIFFDDIDQLHNLSIPDKQEFINCFFRAIRDCYRNRGDGSTGRLYKRLSIVLAGSTPIECLVSDPDCNILGISKPIPMQEFDLEELIDNLQVQRWLFPSETIQTEIFSNRLQAIYQETNGHPHLTILLIAHGRNESLRDLKQRLIDNWEINDELSFIKEIQNQLQADLRKSTLLQLYQRILKGEIITPDKDSLDQKRLRFLGLIRISDVGDRLEVYNSFVAAILNESWANKVLLTATDLPSPLLTSEDLPSGISHSHNIKNPSTHLDGIIHSTEEPNSNNSNKQHWLQFLIPASPGILLAIIQALITVFPEIAPAWFNINRWEILGTVLFIIVLLILIQNWLQPNPHQKLQELGTKLKEQLNQKYIRLIPAWVIILFVVALAFTIIMGWVVRPAMFPTIQELNKLGKDLQEDAAKNLDEFLADEPDQLENLRKTLLLVSNHTALQNRNSRYKPPLLPILALQTMYSRIREHDVLENSRFDGFRNATFSADGQSLAAVGHTEISDADIVVWQKKDDGWVPRTIPSKQSRVTDLDFRDEQFLATAGEDGTIKVWDMRSQSNAPIDLVDWGNRVRVISLDFSDDKNHLAATGEDGLVKIWEWNSQANPLSISQPKQASHTKAYQDPEIGQVSLGNETQFSFVNDVQFKPPISSSPCLATVGNNSLLRVWDQQAQYLGQAQGEIEGKQGLAGKPYLMNSISFSPDGKLLVVGGGSRGDDVDATGVIQIWQVDTQEQGNNNLASCSLKALNFIPVESRIRSLSFDKTGDYLLALGERGLLRVWYKDELVEQNSTERHINQQSPIVDIYNGPWGVGNVRTNPSVIGEFVVTTGENRIRIWRLGDMEKNEQFIHETNWIETNDKIEEIVVRGGNTDKNSNSIALIGGKQAYITGNALLKNSNSLDIANTFTTIAASQDPVNEYLITSNEKGVIQFWDWTTGKNSNQPKSIETRSLKPILALSFSPSENQFNPNILAIATEESVDFWDLKGDRLSGINTIDSTIALRFSSNGQLLAARSKEESIKIWDIASIDRPSQIFNQQEQENLTGRDLQFHPIQQSNRQSVLATLASNGREIQFWKVAGIYRNQSSTRNQRTNPGIESTGKIKIELPEGMPSLLSDKWNRISFSNDGKLLAVGGDGEVIVWDLSVDLWDPKVEPKERVFAFFQGDFGEVSSLTFSSDDQSVVIGGKTGALAIAKVGRLGDGQLIRWACDWMVDYRKTQPDGTDLEALCNPPSSTVSGQVTNWIQNSIHLFP